MPDAPLTSPASPDPVADTIDAGDLGAWLVEVQRAIAGEQASDVPCGSCTACCTSSQFVHIGPDETDTLAHVPRELTFPAPGLPRGHVLLGYDERGHCPMLADGACTIYAHRPRTCRTYDCRVFAATAIEPDEAKVEIRRRVDRWRFRVASAPDRASLAAIRAAATFLREHGAELEARSAAPLPANPTQLAVLAIEVHPAFLPGAGTAAAAGGPVAEPDVEVIARELRRLREVAGQP